MVSVSWEKGASQLVQSIQTADSAVVHIDFGAWCHFDACPFAQNWAFLKEYCDPGNVKDTQAAQACELISGHPAKTVRIRAIRAQLGTLKTEYVCSAVFQEALNAQFQCRIRRVFAFTFSALFF